MPRFGRNGVWDAMVQKRVDPRIARTRRAIKESFLRLAEGRHPDKITVSDVAQGAEVNRKTFYLHFDSIESLMDAVVGDLLDEFFTTCELVPDEPMDFAGHASRFFLFMADRPLSIERLVCTPSYFMFGERVYRGQMARYRMSGDPFDWLPSGEEELVLHFIRSTALDFYRGWVKGGKAIPPSRAAGLLADLTCNGISLLARRPDRRTEDGPVLRDGARRLV